MLSIFELAALLKRCPQLSRKQTSLNLRVTSSFDPKQSTTLVQPKGL